MISHKVKYVLFVIAGVLYVLDLVIRIAVAAKMGFT